jgi:PleD family two-component response regulator
MLSFSAGIALYDPELPSTLDHMITVADERMYEAKRGKTSPQPTTIDSTL